MRILIICTLITFTASAAPPAFEQWTQYESNPFVIQLDMPAPEDSAGGVITADVDNDGLLDYLVTVPGHLAAYSHNGAKLWIREVDIRVGGSSERVGLPGHCGPGVTAGDIDGDGATEVLYLLGGTTNARGLEVVDGATGDLEWRTDPPIPEGTERWEHLVIADFRGEGDRDLLLQTTNKDGYRVGHHLVAYALADLRAGRAKPLWQRADFTTCAHNGARVADLDGDGRDEVLGGTMVGPDGVFRTIIPLRGHIDSIFAYDVRPDLPGLEVVALEEGGSTKDGGGNRVFLYNAERLIWESNYQHWEPQNAAVGEFDAERPGLEIWCRSRYNTHQKPWVHDSKGAVVAHYEMDTVAPKGWTDAGVEIIYTIDWTGGPTQLAAAKERHTDGDLCIFDPVSGAFVERFDEQAARLYVVDVAGDWREELIALNGNELRIYHNAAPNPDPDHPRLWSQPHYRKSKLAYNYYSP
jgi:rhamnogalacturonan lyase-like protein/VCBS repeat protein